MDILIEVPARRHQENEAIREAVIKFLHYRGKIHSHIRRDAIGRGMFFPEAAMGYVDSLFENVCGIIGKEIEEYT